jgi:hypothetical protein
VKKNSIAKRSPKPNSNPHTRSTALVRAYEAGRQKGRREREALEDRILEDLGNVGEVVAELRTRYQLRIAESARRSRSSSSPRC